MLAQRVFLKKTRRGKIMKVVREHYLRDDISCGSSACHCQWNDEAMIDEDSEEPSAFDKTNTLSENADGNKFCSLFKGKPHYIILDTNAVLNQIDLLECPVSEGGFTDVVLLQTVLEEVRKRSSPIYKRLKDLVNDRSRRFYVFINEHHEETYIERFPGESPNDRNDRAIRRAAVWYNSHLFDKGISVVLITNDRENQKIAKEKDNLDSCSIHAYVKAMGAHFPNLVDKLAGGKDDEGRESSQTFQDKKQLFPPHLSTSEINEGVKKGNILRGVFRLSRTNFLEGSVMCESLDGPVLIQGLADQNRSVDGDHVAIQLLEKSKWSAPAEILLDDDGFDPGDTLDDKYAKLLVEAKKKDEEIQPTARVVGILKRKWRQYCGIIQSSPVANTVNHIFVPAEKSVPKVRIETRQYSTLKGQRIIVAIDSWPRHSRYPKGHFVRALGKIGDKATENEVLLLEHDIPHSKFSTSVLECLPKLPWIITDQDRAKRVDCRHLDICSVDPPGCTDIDDALHAFKLPNGNYEVGVHIADVTHFIRPGTAIDAEAAKRSTTVYLTDRRIDMVPELLSSNLCSLRDDGERFAFSCIWEMTEKAEIVNVKFHKSVIHSKASLTYEAAQKRIDDKSDSTSLTEGLRNLLKLSKVLKARRTANGALVLASNEIRFTVDSETADPVDVQLKQVFETNSMVEEFMLAANISVAEKIFEEFPECAMLRRHPSPPASNFDPLVKAGKRQGFEICVDSGKDLANSLDEAVDPKNPYFNTMLRMLTTRCMMQAVYFASGTIDYALFQHYGLACPIYTHFTSPIRRYADVIVHRLLAAAVGADATYPKLLDKKATSLVANNINYRHRMAQYASRASVNLHTHLFFRERTTEETGYILMIRQNAVQILIPKYGLEGTLFLRANDKDSDKKVEWIFDDEEPSQSCSGVKLRLFQKVTVQLSLDSSNIQHEKLVLRLVDPYIEGFSVNTGSNDQLMDCGEQDETQKRPIDENEVEKSGSKKKKKKGKT